MKFSKGSTLGKLVCCLVALAPMVGCAADTGEETGESGEALTKLAENAKASLFPEAVLVNMPGRRRCSGVLVNPRTVITAGHCTNDLIGAPSSSITVIAPNAGGQRSQAVVAYDVYKGTALSIDPNTRDLAMLTLDRPITVDYYPPIHEKTVGNGRLLRAVGREHDGQISDDDLFVGKKVPAHRGTPDFFPLDYYTRPIVESADSGGPVYVGRYKKRQLAGVVAGQKLVGKDLALVASVAAGPNFDLAGIYEHPVVSDEPEEDAD